MGAATFVEITDGPSALDAFKALVEQAIFEHGAGGYTGTIAEKSLYGFRMIEPTEDTSDWSQNDYEKWAWNLVSNDDERIAEKFGPAGCTKLGDTEFMFFGWASS